MRVNIVLRLNVSTVAPKKLTSVAGEAISVNCSDVIITVFRPESKNASSPMLVTVSGMSIEVKLDAPENASSPMLSSREPSSNVTEVKPDASLNARSPMLVTLDGMLMEIKLDAPWNA